MARKSRPRGFCVICSRVVAIKQDGTAQVHGRKYSVFTSDFMGYNHERQVEVGKKMCSGSGLTVRIKLE